MARPDSSHHWGHRGVATAFLVVLTLGSVACGGGDEAANDQAEIDRELALALTQAEADVELRDASAEAVEREAELKAREDALQERELELAAQQARTREEELRQREAVVRERERALAAEAAARATPAPVVAAAVAPEPEPEPEMVTLTVPSGSTFRATLDEELSTGTNRVGDSFTIRLKDPVVSGRTIIAPAGTVVYGTVTGIRKDDEGTFIDLEFNEILLDGKYYPIRASVESAEVGSRSNQGTGDRAAKIGGGAAVGAILGRVFGGGSKSTVIGAVVGAAAGTGVMLATDGRDAVMEAGSELTIRLEEPLEVEVERN